MPSTLGRGQLATPGAEDWDVPVQGVYAAERDRLRAALVRLVEMQLEVLDGSHDGIAEREGWVGGRGEEC
jgi:hypothetical protein